MQEKKFTHSTYLNKKKHKPYPVTTACKEHLACHQKIQHLIDLPIKVYTLLLLALLSNVYPQQAQQWLVTRIERADQSQWPAKMAYFNRTWEKNKCMHVKITCAIVKSTYSIIRKETWNAHKSKKIKNKMFIFKILTDLIHLIKLANNIKAYIRKFILQKRKENWKELFNCGILH